MLKEKKHFIYVVIHLSPERREEEEKEKIKAII